MQIKVHCAHDEMAAIGKLKPNPANPNKHPPEQIALLAKIIKAQGWRNPIVVSNHGRRKDKKGVANDNLKGNDLRKFLDEAFGSTANVSKPGSCWYVCGPPGVDYRHPLNALESLGIARHGIAWVKDRFVMGRCDYHYRHENIVYGWKPGAAHHEVPTRDQDSVWEFQRPGRSPEHPTIKPTGIPVKAISNSSKAGDIIYDPFLGSGTTIIACEQLGRKCRAMEIDPGYCAVSIQRWADATGKTPKLLNGG